MVKRAVSHLAIAACATSLPLQVRDVPSDMATVLSQVEDMIGDSDYASVVFNAVVNLAKVNGTPEQAAAGDQIMASLFNVLNSENNARDTASVASSVSLMLENANAPTQVAGLINSPVSELKDANANTNMADNVHYMALFVENVMSVLPSAFDDIEIGKSVATHTSSNASDSSTDASENSSTNASENSSSSDDKSSGNYDADSSTAARLTTGMLVLSMSAGGVMALLF
ncbi:hypothetical protein IW136_005509 [Coemansia sp. RSA 678]|nr:hypothetical protein IW136_005509 [Coemansia sp. RSA 678]